ncbi:hypothetical protein GOODEAATRI_028149, partial [Goodea atripinnis]
PYTTSAQNVRLYLILLSRSEKVLLTAVCSSRTFCSFLLALHCGVECNTISARAASLHSASPIHRILNLGKILVTMVISLVPAQQRTRILVLRESTSSLDLQTS